MAGKADFTDEEWDALKMGVTGSGMLVSVAHRDFTDSFGEAKAIARISRHTATARASSSGSSPAPTAPASGWLPRQRRSTRGRWQPWAPR